MAEKTYQSGGENCGALVLPLPSDVRPLPLAVLAPTGLVHNTRWCRKPEFAETKACNQAGDAA